MQGMKFVSNFPKLSSGSNEIKISLSQFLLLQKRIVNTHGIILLFLFSKVIGMANL